jgi:heme-binding protein/cytochrome P460
MRTLAKLMIAAVFILAALQLVRPSIPAKPATADLQAPPEIKHILEKDCYSCHSDQRRLSWFDQVVPGYWLVRHDILTAREHVNFSTLGSKPAGAQKAALYEAVNMIQLGAMPLPSFLKLHPEAKVTSEDLAALKTYLAPWSPAPSPPASAPASIPAPVSLATVPPEFNGFPFDPTFETWKLISATDRGDNHTFRFILGNDIAVKAAQSGSIRPWPDGAEFAKIAWQQEPGPDGLLHPGKFVQVELMLKNASLYKDTEGWGWGRWRGLDLKPYGTDARFVTECTACHKPVSGNDYVYTLPVTSAYQPLAWNAITMYVDPNTHTTATLYGNDTAQQAHGAAGSAPTAAPRYPPGSVLALVTWAQRDDPHWFAARIPDLPQSVEFVQVPAAGQTTSYRSFAGPSLAEAQPASSLATQRASFILGLVPASLP